MILEVKDLKKCYNDKLAVDKVNIQKEVFAYFLLITFFRKKKYKSNTLTIDFTL